MPTLQEKIIKKAEITPGDSVATMTRKILVKVPGYVRSKAAGLKRRFGALRRRAQLQRFEREYLAASARGADVPPSRSIAADEQLIVSLTSYGTRLQTVHLAILSILDQTCPPDKVVLYLDDQTDPALVPDRLRALCGRRFEIREGYPDLRPHKKWLFAMREFPESVIVTIDDDVMYARDTLETLLAAHVEHSGCVVGRRVHLMLQTAEGTLASYNDWVGECQSIPNPTQQLFPTGVGGVLYPPQCIPARAFDEDCIREACLNADDVWLKVAETSLGIQVAYAPNELNHPYAIPGTEGNALCLVNTAEVPANDRYLENAMAYFGVSADQFFARGGGTK